VQPVINSEIISDGLSRLVCTIDVPVGKKKCGRCLTSKYYVSRGRRACELSSALGTSTAADPLCIAVLAGAIIFIAVGVTSDERIYSVSTPSSAARVGMTYCGRHRLSLVFSGGTERTPLL